MSPKCIEEQSVADLFHYKKQKISEIIRTLKKTVNQVVLLVPLGSFIIFYHGLELMAKLSANFESW